ncbi:hypothetical protein D3C85_1190090 [compost metagenome]
MTKEEYLEEHHRITESLIGLISIQADMEGVERILNTWMPKLDEIHQERIETLREEWNKENTV